MQYFAQDEATRLDPTRNVYQTLAGDAPIHMVPRIRNILGGFLFSGDDIEKPVRVLSGGERTRLAVARMLLRPSNTLLLDEPTNHLDLDSKDVLLEALEDFGGTLIFVSHDRYFVDKLATKVIEIGNGARAGVPGDLRGVSVEPAAARRPRLPRRRRRPAAKPGPDAATCRREPRCAAGSNGRAADTRRQPTARRRPSRSRRRPTRRPRSSPTTSGGATKPRPAGCRKAADALRKRVDELEARIADRERAIKELEATMSAPGFYDNHEASKPVITNTRR